MHYFCMSNGIKNIRLRQNLTQAQFGEKVGVSQMYVANLENGNKTLNLKRVKQISELFDCTEAEVWGYEIHGNPIPIISQSQAGELSLPMRINQFIDNNDGTIFYEGNPSGKFAVRAEGGSMNRIAQDGSVLIVDTNDSLPIDGQCYIFQSADGKDSTFKRFRRGPERLEPYSTFSAYEDMPMRSDSPNEDWNCVGRVIEIRQYLKK